LCGGFIRTNVFLILYCTQGLSVIRGSIRTNGLLILYCTQGLSVIRGSIRTNGLLILYCTQGLSVIRGSIRTNGLVILYCSYDSYEKSTNWTFELGIGGRTNVTDVRIPVRNQRPWYLGQALGYASTSLIRRRRPDTCIFIFILLLHIHLYMIIFISIKHISFHYSVFTSTFSISVRSFLRY
jgi:hypothetical protein